MAGELAHKGEENRIISPTRLALVGFCPSRPNPASWVWPGNAGAKNGSKRRKSASRGHDWKEFASAGAKKTVWGHWGAGGGGRPEIPLDPCQIVQPIMTQLRELAVPYFSNTKFLQKNNNNIDCINRMVFQYLETHANYTILSTLSIPQYKMF